MNDALKNRVKGFLWSLGAMVLVALISFLLENEAVLELPGWLVVVLGLVLAQVTKFVNVDLKRQ